MTPSSLNEQKLGKYQSDYFCFEQQHAFLLRKKIKEFRILTFTAQDLYISTTLWNNFCF